MRAEFPKLLKGLRLSEKFVEPTPITSGYDAGYTSVFLPAFPDDEMHNEPLVWAYTIASFNTSESDG